MQRIHNLDILLLIITSPIWLWLLGVALNIKWLMIPMAWIMMMIFKLGGYTTPI